MAEQFPVPGGQRRRQFPQPVQWRAPAQLEDHVAVGAGGGIRVSHRTAALCHQGMDLGLRQAGADRAVREHPAVEEQPALPQLQSPACHPAHDGSPGDMLVQVGEQVTNGERERVADHQARARRVLLEPVAAERATAGRPGELHGERLDRDQARGQPQRNGWLGFDLAGAAGHRLRHAADQRDLAGFPGDRRNENLRVAEEVLGGEQHRERGGGVPEHRARLADGPPRRRAGIRGEHQRASGLHPPQVTRRSGCRCIRLT